jgi:Kdo2-lipid IVA lauroyltransferase/acyltransferase
MKIKTRRYYIYYLLKVLFFIISCIPLRVSLFIADMLGKAAFRVVVKYRRTAVENLDSVFEGDHGANVLLAEKVFRNIAKNGAEWIKLSSSGPEALDRIVVGIKGREHLDEALAGGRGVIMFGAHFGNWELLALYLRRLGYNGAVVGRRIYFHKYDKLITGMRGKFGVEVIYRDESPRKMLRVLRDGGILGIVPDQDVDSVDGVFVDFLGRPAYTPTAPVKLAAAAGASLMPGFVVRRKDGRHEVVVGRPVEIPEAGDEPAVERSTQAWTRVLEGFVREYPEQWVWLHKRWKTRPADVRG